MSIVFLLKKINFMQFAVTLYLVNKKRYKNTLCLIKIKYYTAIKEIFPQN